MACFVTISESVFESEESVIYWVQITSQSENEKHANPNESDKLILSVQVIEC